MFHNAAHTPKGLNEGQRAGMISCVESAHCSSRFIGGSSKGGRVKKKKKNKQLMNRDAYCQEIKEEGVILTHGIQRSIRGKPLSSSGDDSPSRSAVNVHSRRSVFVISAYARGGNAAKLNRWTCGKRTVSRMDFID